MYEDQEKQEAMEVCGSEAESPLAARNWERGLVSSAQGSEAQAWQKEFHPCTPHTSSNPVAQTKLRGAEMAL